MKRHHLHRIHRHFQVSLLVLPVILLLGYFVLAYSAHANTPQPMNIVMISIDSLRPDHMGLYGYKRNTTPNIDEWAKDAVVFKDHFSTSYLTPISEVSVHTGKYPFTTGVINFESGLASSTPTLGEILKNNGWQTAAFGSSAEFADYVAGRSLARGFDSYDHSHAGKDIYNGRGGNPIARSIPWVKDASKKNKPFFLWVTLGSVHWPYGQSEPNHFSSSTYDGYFKTASVNTWALVDYVYKNQIFGRTERGGKLKPVAPLSQEDFDFLIGRYDDGIVMTDRRVGELLSYLKDSGLDKNTLVIIETEHGEGFNERGYVMHYDIFDEQVHTPLLIKAPNIPSKQVNALTSGVDLLPTILSILHLPETPTDGVSLMPLLSGSSTSVRNEVYLTRTSLWERIMNDYEGLADIAKVDDKEHFADVAIRTNEWKLIHRRAREALKRWGWHNNFANPPIIYTEYELYDLSRDPGETQNIYENSKQEPPIVALQAQLSDWEKGQFAKPQPETTIEEIQPYF